MVEIGIEGFFTVLLVLGLLLFLAVSAYYDNRDRLYYDAPRRRHVHHCVKCGKLYTSSETGLQVACPECGFKNSALRF